MNLIDFIGSGRVDRSFNVLVRISFYLEFFVGELIR